MKKFKIEYLIYIFIIICPFLDSFSFLFREFFPQARISPSTILRSILPGILLIHLFIKDKTTRKFLIGSAFLFLVYGGVHLYLFQKNVSIISYGNVITEAQYLINYIYMIYLFYIILYYTKNNTLPFLKKSLFIMLCSYIFLLYLSILTKTSYSTYLEGMGYKGWFLSGNSLSTILVLLCGTLVSFIIQSKKLFYYVVYLLTGVYLLFLVGTRTGMFGYLLVTGFNFFLLFFFFLFNKKRINRKVLLIVIFLLLFFGGIFLKVGSSTLERRKHISSEEVGIVDVNTKEVGHTSGDTSLFVYQIKQQSLDDSYMNQAQQKAYLRMYEYANSHKLKSNAMRKQQLLYNWYLIKEQKNLGMLLFGNGYLANYGEMILEMEIPALLLNFGIFGFLLFFVPFVFVFICMVKRIIKNRQITLTKLMYLFSILLGLFLSFFAGYVFFSVSCVLVLICLYSLLYEEEML